MMKKSAAMVNLYERILLLTAEIKALRRLRDEADEARARSIDQRIRHHANVRNRLRHRLESLHAA